MRQSGNTPSDEQLLRLLGGKREARERGFRLLVATYGDRLYAHVHRLTGNHADTDDALQEALVKVFRHIDRFNGESKLYTWLYRIATNEALSLLKRRKRARMISTDNTVGTVAEPRGDAHFDAATAHQLLLRAVGSLPEKQRLVFNLRYFDELSYREISEIVDTSVGGLKASYHHAVKKVEAFLKTQPALRG